MKILALESSALVAGAAVIEDGKVLADFCTDHRKTHSQTLLPMVDELKKTLDLDMSTLDAVAVSRGPGSFTGLRIGSATAKGIALALDKPVIEVPTLDAMAYQLYPASDVICPIMDARRSEVYTRLYEFRGEELCALTGEMAVPLTELLGIAGSFGQSVIFTGDGVPVSEHTIRSSLSVPFRFALPFQNRQRAAAVGVLAYRMALKGQFTDADSHVPVYLRLSQAERERKKAETKC